jgi:hypothetical protein
MGKEIGEKEKFFSTFSERPVKGNFKKLIEFGSFRFMTVWIISCISEYLTIKKGVA